MKRFISRHRTLNIDPTAFNMDGSKSMLQTIYSFLHHIRPLYFKYRNSDRLQTFIKRNQWHYGDLLEFENYRFKMCYQPYTTGKPISGGGMIALDENRFLLFGMNTKVEFMAKRHEHCQVGKIEIGEVIIQNGEIIKGRVLNGDEQMGVVLNSNLTCMLLELYKY